MPQTTPNPQAHTHELIIIGAGPAGLSCSIAAQQAGIEHVVLEKGSVANSIYHFPADLLFFSTPELLAIGGVPFTCPDKKPSRRQVVAYYRQVAAHFALPVMSGRTVRSARRVDGGFELTIDRHGQRHRYRSSLLVIATGFFDTPTRLGVPGEELPKCAHYFHDAHPYFGQQVAVVGGGNSAAETALDLQRVGAHVTLVHRGAELKKGVKYWVRPEIENRIARGEIAIHYRTVVCRVEPEVLVLDGPDGELALANDAVIFQIGYQPTDALLRELGVARDAQSAAPAHDPHTFATEVPGLYACGVVTAGSQMGKIFIENARFHGERIVAAITADRQRHEQRAAGRAVS